MGALLTTMLLFVLIESASMKFLDSCRAERKWNETHVAIDGVHRRSAGADRRIGKTVPLCGQVALNCGLTVLNTRDNQQYLKTVDLNQAMLEAAAIRGRNRWDNKGLITQGCAGGKKKNASCK
jgi:hypothetical protein